MIHAGVYTLFAGGSLAEAAHLRPPDRGRRGGAGDHTIPSARCTIPSGRRAPPPRPWKKPQPPRPWTMPSLPSLRRCPTKFPLRLPCRWPTARWRSWCLLLYGNITQGASTLGFGGTSGCPAPRGETSEALEASRGVPSLIMADGPRRAAASGRAYQVDPRRRWGDPHRGAGFPGKRIPGRAPASGGR